MSSVISLVILCIVPLILANAGAQATPSMRRALKEGSLPEYLESEDFQDLVTRTSSTAKARAEKSRSLQSAAPFPHPIHPVPPIHPSNSSGSGDESSNNDDGSSGSGDASSYGSSDGTSYGNPYYWGNQTQIVSNSTAGNDTSVPSDGDGSSSSSGSRQAVYMTITAAVLGLIVLVPLIVVFAAPGTFFPKSGTPFAGSPSAAHAADSKMGLPMMVSGSGHGNDDAPNDHQANNEEGGRDLESGASPSGEGDGHGVQQRSSWLQSFSFSGLFSYAPKWAKVNSGEDNEDEDDDDEKSQGGSDHVEGTARTTADSSPVFTQDDRVRADFRESTYRQYTEATNDIISNATTDLEEDAIDEANTTMDNMAEKERLVDGSEHSLIEDISSSGKQVDDKKHFRVEANVNDAISI